MTSVPLSAVLRILADEYGVSVIVEEGLDERPVTMDLDQVPVSAVMESLGRRYGADAVQRAGLWYLGQVDQRDRALMVTRLGRYSVEQGLDLVKVMLSESGDVVVTPSGTAIIADQPGVLRQVSDALEELSAVRVPTWVVQLYLVSLDVGKTREFGFDVDQALSVSGQFHRGSFSSDHQGLLSGSLSALLRLGREQSAAHIETRPLLVLRSGERSQIRQGLDIPVPRRSVSDQGTVTVVGYDMIETGLALDVSLAEIDEKQASIRIHVSSSDVVALVGDEVPQVSTAQLHTSLDVVSGGVYLAGQVERSSQRGTASGPLIPTIATASDTQHTLQVWLRCHRLSTPESSSVLASARIMEPSDVTDVQSDQAGTVRSTE